MDSLRRARDEAVDPNIGRASIKNVVFVDVPLRAAHLILYLEFAAGCAFVRVTWLSTVVVQSVIDEDIVVAAASSIAVTAPAGRSRITADGVTAGIGFVEYVVAHRSIPAVTRELAFGSGSRSGISARPLGAIGLTDLIFAGRLDAVVDLKDHVPLEGDIGAPITVEAVGVVLVALTRIRYSADVIDCVPADLPIHCLVVADGADAFVSNGSDADVVIVVNEIIGNVKVSHVPIHVH